MITINGERELVTIESWSDLLGRPHFQQRINPATVTLDKLIGTYHLSTPVPCGLSNCRTPHVKGYLAVTKQGLETNIGNVCGKNTFGVDFEAARRTLHQDMQEKAHREAVRTFQAMLPLHQDELASLRGQQHGIDWAHKHVATLMDPTRVPEPIRRALGEITKSGNPAITRTRQATRQEQEQRQAARAGPEVDDDKPKRPQFVVEELGVLEGAAALRPEFDLRRLVVLDLEPKMEAVATLAVDSERASAIADAARWIREFDEKMERVRRGLALCRALLTKSNLLQLTQLELSSRQVAEFKRAIADLPERAPTRV